MIINIPSEALKLQEKLVQYRHDLHAMPELDLSLPATSAYVAKALEEIGITPSLVGGSGLTFTLGNAATSGKTVLLRADMDGLPIKEETGLPYASCNGNMHACGHDMHTAMLLGAAELLKAHENKLSGTVKFLFQPGEETMHGAVEAIREGVLEDPHVDAALMVHVMTGMPLPEGTIVASSTEGIISASSDWFDICIKGKGMHGAIAGSDANPLETVTRIYLSLQEISKTMLAQGETVVISVGVIQGGTANNVIPETAVLKGSVRTFSDSARLKAEVMIRECAQQTAQQCGTTAEVTYIRGCPSAITDHDLNQQLINTIIDCYGESSFLDINKLMPGGRLPGSEDFSFFTREVPCTLAFLAAGCTSDGYIYPIHNPRTAFSDEVLHRGAAIYAGFALNWLKSNQL